MSLPPDTSEISVPKDPAAYRPRPLLGFGFWVMMAFAVLCVLAGVAIANLGPRLLAPKSSAKSTAGLAVAEAPLPPTSPPIALPAPLAAAPVAAPADADHLAARIAALEAQSSRVSQSAAAALAVAAVAEASQNSGPFADELAGLRAVAPPSPELAALARLAESGAPSRAALAASFPDYAARAAGAAHVSGERATVRDRISHALSTIIALRRVGDVSGSGPDALLARAERLVQDGDIARALKLLDRLPPAARDTLTPWRDGAERRAEIDRAATALRARTIEQLAAARSGA